MKLNVPRVALLIASMTVTACSSNSQATSESNVQQSIGSPASGSDTRQDPLASNELVVEQGGTEAPTSCINLYYAEPRHGAGICYPTGSYDGNCQAAVARFEDSSGRRVASYQPFSGGLIVTFQDGGQKALWNRLIDCKDPQYDPTSSTSGM